MSRGTANHLGCDDIDRIQLQLSRGEPVDAEDARLFEEHLASCERCRCETDAAELLAFDGTDGPAPAMDDLSRRRWVNEIVEQATRPRGGARDQDLGADRVSARYRPLVALVGVAACGLLVAGWWAWFSGSDAAIERSPTKRFTSQLAMTSGDVRTAGEPAQARRTLYAGDFVSTTHGTAVLRLAGGVIAHLSANTEVQLVRPDEDPPELFLRAGRLVAAVDRHSRGDLAFTVKTRAGRVEVTGTVFAVDVNTQNVNLQVLEGSVRVSVPGATQRVVKNGQSLAVGGDTVRSLSSREISTLAASAEPLSFFRPDRAARLTLRSLPVGATARVDGVVLGRTPLSVTLNAGARMVEVSHDGYEPSRERIAPADGDEIVREVVLSRLRAGPPEDGTSNRATAALRTERRSRERKPSVEKSEAQEASADRSSSNAADPPPLQKSALDLLSRARDRRQAGDWTGAAEAYKTLLERFPNQSETGVALTGLAEILLGKLRDPAAAERNFDEYLRRFPKGTLAQEAAYGRARALRQLGREAEEATSLERFIDTYPSAVQARVARQRLLELREKKELISENH